MSHLAHERQKLLNRVKRIRGQIDAIEAALVDGKDSPDLLHNIAGVRGALAGLMSEVIESHVRYHVANPNERAGSDRARATEELIDAVRTYLR